MIIKEGINGTFEVGERTLIREGAIIEKWVTIGDDCHIGYNTTIKGDDGTEIGNHVYISHQAVIASGTIIEDDVFIGPNVTIMNTKHIQHGRDPKYTGQRTFVIIRRGARIGGGAVLLPGVEIGEEAMIGAGAVVVKDCKPFGVYVGNPARFIKLVDETERL
jgi:UDP-2-acetamido-3-amino-2,3-dideoxy-glucuronate N-acetyltransferase